MDVMVLLNPAERDSVLAALRLLQAFNDGLLYSSVAGADDMIVEIRDHSGKPLTNLQIDALCAQINC